MKRVLISAFALLAFGGVVHAQNYNEELNECMRNPTSRWCQTMQQQDRDQAYENNQRFEQDRRAQMCQINPNYCD